MAESEVARIRRQIALECEAMVRGLHAYASMAQHEFIRAKFNALEGHFENLVPLTGQEQALDILVQTYNEVVK
ncbi:hypothetical protein EPA93_04275 [Ktedonosporobacter rubrisoli]|uniref:Uncharacterized protein n=1 Tax=Ktedonosporobacter rubrisoli TaxID=2509675 RepID=A0A4P6JJX1_KTERU|nr:hypothetical protein [Ktedonosporobacter rubrisoli]QBD75252.1 hypothetical protein EPA93_04275 [Ktedonosporobacter rubrisoli]